MLSLAFPLGAGCFRGIWDWPENIYILSTIFCVCSGAYAFLVIRNLKDAGHSLLSTKAHVVAGALNFLAFALLAIPLGISMHFVQPHASRPAGPSDLSQIMLEPT